jgi:hypothetical protein
MIIDLNISHYRELLKSATEPSKRRIIVGLLAEEESKLARLSREERQSAGHSRQCVGSMINS